MSGAQDRLQREPPGGRRCDLVHQDQAGALGTVLGENGRHFLVVGLDGHFGHHPGGAGAGAQPVHGPRDRSIGVIGRYDLVAGFERQRTDDCGYAGAHVVDERNFAGIGPDEIGHLATGLGYQARYSRWNQRIGLVAIRPRNSFWASSTEPGRAPKDPWLQWATSGSKSQRLRTSSQSSPQIGLAPGVTGRPRFSLAHAACVLLNGTVTPMLVVGHYRCRGPVRGPAMAPRRPPLDGVVDLAAVHGGRPASAGRISPAPPLRGWWAAEAGSGFCHGSGNVRARRQWRQGQRRIDAPRMDRLPPPGPVPDGGRH